MGGGQTVLSPRPHVTHLVSQNSLYNEALLNLHEVFPLSKKFCRIHTSRTTELNKETHAV